MKRKTNVQIMAIWLSILAGFFLFLSLLGFYQRAFLTGIIFIVLFIASILMIPLYKWTYNNENGTPGNEK